MEKDKALNLLGLMRRANVLIVGEYDTGAAVRSQNAKLVIVAADASENAHKRASGFVYGRGTQLVTVPFTKDELSERLGKTGCSMAAICDLGFADAFLTILCEDDAEAFGEAKKLIAEELMREKKRKATGKPNEKNKRRSLRRNNA